MGKKDKLTDKALENPQNLRFNELCKLAESFGMKKRKKKGSHVVYKRLENPKFSLSIQDVNGHAKPYQVKQLIDLLKKHKLIKYDPEE